MGGEAQRDEEQGVVVNCANCGAAVTLPLNWKAAEAQCPQCQGRMAIPPVALARLADLRREAKEAARQDATEQRAAKKRQRREGKEAARVRTKARREAEKRLRDGAEWDQAARGIEGRGPAANSEDAPAGQAKRTRASLPETAFGVLGTLAVVGGLGIGVACLLVSVLTAEGPWGRGAGLVPCYA